MGIFFQLINTTVMQINAFNCQITSNRTISLLNMRQFITQRCSVTTSPGSPRPVHCRHLKTASLIGVFTVKPWQHKNVLTKTTQI